MKIRAVLSVVFIVMLAPLMTGCLCSGPIIKKMNERREDTFNPSAVYRRGSTNGFALEGTRQDKRTTYHAFLIIREDILEDAQLQTNENLSLEDIQKMYSGRFYNEQETTRNAPPHYERVAVLPKNDISIGIQEHHSARSWFGLLLPVTVVVDVATFPFQAIYVVVWDKYLM